MEQENRIIVADSGWAESLPKWLLDDIRSERMINGMINLATDSKDSFSDSEMVAYLMTASNRGPLSHNLAEIYLLLTAKLMVKCKGLTKETLPDFLKETYDRGLNPDQERELEDLRSSLLRKRGKVNHPLFDALKQLKGGKK